MLWRFSIEYLGSVIFFLATKIMLDQVLLYMKYASLLLVMFMVCRTIDNKNPKKLIINPISYAKMDPSIA